MTLSLDAIERAQATMIEAGTPVLAHLTWWSLRSNKITSDDLEAIAVMEGLDKKMLPTAIKPSGAFRSAWRSLEGRMPSGLMLREWVDSKDEIVIAVVREKIKGLGTHVPGATTGPGTLDADYDALTKITFNKGIKTITFNEIQPGTPIEFEPAFRKTYRHFLNLTTKDIRLMIARYLGRVGIMLHGGIYAVPQSEAPTLDALRRVVTKIPNAANAFPRLPIPATEEVKVTLGTVAEADLGEEIRQLEAAMADFDFSKAREKTLFGKLDEFSALRNRVDMYAGILSMKSSELTARLDALHAHVSYVANGGDLDHAPGFTVAPPPPAEDIPVFDTEAGF